MRFVLREIVRYGVPLRCSIALLLNERSYTATSRLRLRLFKDTVLEGWLFLIHTVSLSRGQIIVSSPSAAISSMVQESNIL